MPDEQSHLSSIRDSVESESTTSEEILAELVEQNHTMLDTLENIEKQLKILNIHQSIATGEIIGKEDIE